MGLCSAKTEARGVMKGKPIFQRGPAGSDYRCRAPPIFWQQSPWFPTPNGEYSATLPSKEPFRVQIICKRSYSTDAISNSDRQLSILGTRHAHPAMRIPCRSSRSSALLTCSLCLHTVVLANPLGCKRKKKELQRSVAASAGNSRSLARKPSLQHLARIYITIRVAIITTRLNSTRLALARPRQHPPQSAKTWDKEFVCARDPCSSVSYRFDNCGGVVP